MSRNAAMWRALGHLAGAEEQALDRLILLAEGVRAVADVGDFDGARTILDEYAGLRLLSEALPSWWWLGEWTAFGFWRSARPRGMATRRSREESFSPGAVTAILGLSAQRQSGLGPQGRWTMIVNRRTFVVKRGCMEDIVALSIAQRERIGRPYRIYLPEIGPFDVIAFEFEFENLQEYERTWAEWFGAPETAGFLAKWYDLTESGGTNEIWTLAE